MNARATFRSALIALSAISPSIAMAGVGTIVAPAVTSSLVLKVVRSDLYGLNVVSGASAGYVLVFDATSAPANGAVNPALCLPVAANTGLDWNFRSAPVQFMNGIVVTFSTTGCYSQTLSATAFISGSVQ